MEIPLSGRNQKKRTKVIPLKIGTWNVVDSAGSDRPQRRMTLVDRELGMYVMQIAAPIDARFAEVGEINEVGAGLTFFCLEWTQN